MRGFLAILTRFRRDERGVFAIIFALCAIVIVALAGAVVDFTSVQQARTRAQVALDAAALALQPKINDASVTEEMLRGQAEGLVKQQVEGHGVTVSVTSATKNTANGTLNLKASVGVPMAFVRLVGVNSMTAGLESEATRKKISIELVMVLDNSGSMAQESRMANLKPAAKCAVNILLHDVPDAGCDAASSNPKVPNTRIAIVPFTQAVNVGASNATASWIDTAGISSIAKHNFDDDDRDDTPFTGNVDRIALMKSMTGMSWSGCVEARPHTPTTGGLHLDTDDTVPTSATPDTLYVPLFAPDEPSGASFYNSYIGDSPASCTRKIPKVVWTQTKTGCSYAANDSYYYSFSCSGATTNTYTQTDQNGTVTTVAALPASIYSNNQTSTSSFSYSNTYSGGKYNNSRTQTIYYDYSRREYQERLCKYSGATPSYTAGATGPNVDCPVAITPLTDNSSTLLTAIGKMVSNGGTNIHEGAAWGWRVLSPTLPFDEATTYESAASKVMILMTDGENTTYSDVESHKGFNGSEYYSANGFPYNSNPTNFRLGWLGADDATLEAEMDARTVEACNGAKAKGITVYTIGLKSPEDRKATLRACASDNSKAYFPTASSELNTVFRAIAKELSALRLSK